MFKFDINSVLSEIGDKSSRHAVLKEGDLDVGILMYPPNQITPDHKHSNIDEIFYVVSGSGTITINDKPHLVKEKEIIFSPHDEVHGFINTSDENWIVLQIKLNI